MVREGVDSRVRTTMTTDGEVYVIRGIQDMGVGTKRKEDSSSSNQGKKQKTYVLFRTDLKDRAKANRTKARMGHLVRQGR